MTHCVHERVFLSRRKLRREKILRKMKSMRDAKERKRMANPSEREPKWERYYPLEFGVRNKLTGETAFVDLKSVRHAAKAIGLVLNYYNS